MSDSQTRKKHPKDPDFSLPPKTLDSGGKVIWNKLWEYSCTRSLKTKDAEFIAWIAIYAQTNGRKAAVFTILTFIDQGHAYTSMEASLKDLIFLLTAKD